jgi:D-sedoheptulose 7-phosphate isomerase
MMDSLSLHVTSLRFALDALSSDLRKLEAWGSQLSKAFAGGYRLFIAGNGGSAAQAQHLAAELVGRYKVEREPYCAIALHTDTSTITAIANDYGYEHVFARQLQALARPGDFFLGISTSGRSLNIRKATQAALAVGMHTFALTGDVPNPLAGESHEFLAVPSTDTATVQEVHLVALHLMCEALDYLAQHQTLVLTTSRDR